KPITLHRAEQCGGTSDFAKTRLIDRAMTRRPAQRLREAEELAPRLFHAVGIAAVHLVHLRYVPVVEGAGNWQGAHVRFDQACPKCSRDRRERLPVDDNRVTREAS